MVKAGYIDQETATRISRSKILQLVEDGYLGQENATRFSEEVLLQMVEAGYVDQETAARLGEATLQELVEAGYIDQKTATRLGEEALRQMVKAGYIDQEDLTRLGEATLQGLVEAGYINQEDAAKLGEEALRRMVKAGYIDREDLTRLGEEALKQTISDLSEKQYQILKDYWGKNWDVVNEMWNGVGDKYGAEELSKKAMENILGFLEDHSEDMEGATSTMKGKVLGEWKGLLDDVMEYTDGLSGLKIKSPDYSGLSTGLTNMSREITTTADNAEREYARIRDAAAKPVPSSGGGGGTNKKPVGNTSPPAKTKYTTSYSGGSSRHSAWNVRDNASGKIHKVQIDTRGTFIDGKKVDMDFDRLKSWFWFPEGNFDANKRGFKTGGTTERTGMHWLDGKPGAPERILSPGQNKEFEKLLGTLTANHSSPSDNSDVVNTLMSVVKAVYDSGQESAKTIVEAIGDLEQGDQGASIRSIATKHGISINRRGDK